MKMCGFILFWNWFSETIWAVIYVQKFLWGQFSKLGERLKCDSSDLNVGASLKLALPSLNHTKFLFSHFHIQVKYLNSNSTLNVGASVKITLPSLLLLLSQNQWKTLISLGFVSSFWLLIGNSLVYIKAHEPQKLHFDLHLRLAWVALTILLWYCGTGVGLSGNQL